MRKTWVLWGSVLAAAAVACTLLLRPSAAAGASALSASPAGWLAARTYLERRGSRVSLLDRPLEQAAKVMKGRSLILVFPWQGFPSKEGLDALHQGLAAGGTVVFAYSGHSRSIAEDFVASALGLDFGGARGEPPLSPRRWYTFVREKWRLKPEPVFAPGSAPEVVIQAPDRVPNAPKDAEVLYRGGDKGVPALFSFRRSRGRVIVVPADGLSNARLGNSGNADLLESLRVALGEAIAFDEYHHGLVAPEVLADSGSAPNLDLLLAQLLLLYLVMAWALGRRFGPAWEEPPEIASSTEAFLLGLGALHRKLRHAAPACVRLIQDAESLDPGVQAPLEVRNIAFDAGDHAFLEVAKVIARLQRRGRFD